MSFEKPWFQWTDDENKKAKFDCIAKNIITSALDSKEIFRISECESAKEMWDTLKATHESITEIKKEKTRSQARRKRRQNKKGLNPCFMAKKKDDSSSESIVSSSASLNAENYSQLLQAFKETHEEANRLTLLNNWLKGMNNWLENRVKSLEEELENSNRF